MANNTLNRNHTGPLSRLPFLFGALGVVVVFAVIAWPRTQTHTPASAAREQSVSAPVVINAMNAAAASLVVTSNVGCALRFVFAPTGVSSVAPGATLTYHLALTNTGNKQCNGTSISVYYADNESVLSTMPSPHASDYYWVPGNLAPGASWQGTVVTTVAKDAAGSVSNEACATGANSPDVCAYNLIPVGLGAQTMLPNASVVALPTSSEKKEVGLWVWQTPLQMSSAYQRRVVDTAAAEGFTALYVTVDDYVPIADMGTGAAKTAAESDYFAKLHDFIALAKGRGIAVDIEGGASDWGQSENRWKGYALIDLLQSYNNTYPNAPARGLQYDVESYLSSAYTGDKQGVLTDFANFVAESARQMADKNPGKRFSVVIPHFYDDKVAWTPEILFNGTREYVLTALLQGLQANPGSYLIVMAYRNFLDGTNGTIALAHAEVTEASNGYATKVIVAQETGNVPPGYVTFYGKSREELYTALAGIESAFEDASAFGGVAVDYFEPFVALRS